MVVGVGVGGEGDDEDHVREEWP
jgi:hypothetical protein